MAERCPLEEDTVQRMHLGLPFATQKFICVMRIKNPIRGAVILGHNCFA